MGVSLPSAKIFCVDCGGTALAEEAKSELIPWPRNSYRNSPRYSTTRTQQSNYLREDDIEQIRLACEEKSRELTAKSRKPKRAYTHSLNHRLLKTGPVHINLKLRDLVQKKSDAPPKPRACNLVDRVKGSGSPPRGPSPLRYRRDYP